VTIKSTRWFVEIDKSAIFAAVTAASIRLALPMASVATFALVILRPAKISVVTAPFANFSVVTAASASCSVSNLSGKYRVSERES